MEHIAVRSSDLRSVGYDSNSSTLEIKFRSGGLYQYYNVPISVYNGLMAASSHGKYFHRILKENIDTIEFNKKTPLITFIFNCKFYSTQ